MSNIDDIFNSIFDELISATEKQRNFHTSAFGKENAMDMIAEAERNRQKLDCWWSLLQDMKVEMMESGLFGADKKPVAHRRSSEPLRISRDDTGTKPVSVTVLGQHRPVRYWKDILLFVCKVLYEKQPNKFLSIENEPTLQGRSNPYISTDARQLRKPERIEGSPYFVEINLSKVYCKKISYLILKWFGYNSSDLNIEETGKGSYCRMESKVESGTAKGNLKVGQRARSAIGKLLSGNILSAEELSLLCESDYSKQIFGAALPVLRLIPPGKTADDVRLDNYGRPRYYREIYDTNGGKYMISSQWYEKQYSKLEGYLSKYGA